MSAGKRWQDQAACLGHDPEMWFDEKYYDRAIEICKSCPVILRCRDFGRTSTCGVFGGVPRDQKGAGPSLTNAWIDECGTDNGRRHRAVLV